MNLQDAIQKAQQILDQERVEPTVSYKETFLTGQFVSAVGSLVLTNSKGAHRLRENVGSCLFQSTNFDLLSALLDQVSQSERAAFFGVLRSRILDRKAVRHKHHEVRLAGSWRFCSSELPLIAEFLTRRGDKRVLIETLCEAPVGPGQTLLLVQLQEMIALNFTLFRDDEYLFLLTAIDRIRRTIKEPSDRKGRQDVVESNSMYHASREMPELCIRIEEACRKARYFYVKGELSLDTNLEINQDENAVRDFLEKLGFSKMLVESLNEMERSYRAAVTPFELKSSMSHLRSFLEGLHSEACAAANKKFGGPIPSRWGESLKYLRDHNVLTPKEEQLVSAFYTLMSDTTVHPLIAEREYARLMRNMSIEYGLLLLTKLDKLGLK